jgi:hypothetical protein
MKLAITPLRLLLCCCLLWQAAHYTASAQCISSTPQADIGCDNAPVTLTATLPAYMSGLNSSIFWSGTSPQATGTSYTFTPNCAALGEKSFTPCLPAGSNIPARSFIIGPYNGTIPVGQTATETFSVSGICFQQGVSTYTGNLGLSVTGNGGDQLDICLTLPSGNQICTGPIAISTIQSLGGSIPISLLQLTEDPNGTWLVNITNVAGNSGSAGYNLTASTITVPAYSTSTAICADPVEFYVFGGCPTFVSAQASQASVCSGDNVTLSATLNPLGAPNVSYAWIGPNGFSSTLPTPTVNLTNTTCDPETRTYTLQTLTCTNNGSLVTSNRPVNITVYPELTLADIIVDNTTNIQDPDCSISVAVTCPNFTVNGQIGQNTTGYLPGDNGTQGEFIISNGLAACNLVINPAITCLSNCNPPVATATAVCQGATQFTVNVNITAMGDAASYTIIPSQGSALTINGIGNYSFGPYPNNSSINIKIVNDLDVNCNINLGNVQQTCKTCPELLNAAVAGGATSRCAGDVANFTATISAGYVLNTDYRIQWQLNGVNIPNATALTYSRTLSSTDYCAAEAQTYTAIVTCLNGGTPAAVSTLTAATINVYNRPRFGQEFTVESCSAMPIDNCNDNLVISNGGAANPAPGTTAAVTYTVSINGAPGGCSTIGSFTATCPACTGDNPGTATTTEQVVCWGDNFGISSAGALVVQPGFVVGLAVSTQPITNISSTANLQSQADIGIFGPYASPGTINPAEFFDNNGLDLPQPTSPCGATYFFTPFLSFTSIGGVKQSISGTYEATGYRPLCQGLQPVPGIGGGVSTISGVPYCSGLAGLSYNINYCSYNTDNFSINPNSCEVLGNTIPNGGINSDLPNINACTTGCYSQNNWTANPNGENISNTIVIVPLTPDAIAPCSETGHVNWSLNVTQNGSFNFPTICPSCNSLGESVAVTILPTVTTANITTTPSICLGDSFDLSTLNPASTPATIGTYIWYNGNPNLGATALTSTVVSPTTTTMYCVQLDFCNNGACPTEAKCMEVSVKNIPTLNSVTPTPICPGSSVNLTQYNNQFTTQSGTFQWYLGNPDATAPAGALIANPSSVIPIGSERYYIKYTPPNGCATTAYIQFSYNSLPILLAATPESCSGSSVNLRDNQSIMTSAAGTFQWYNGNPSAGGAPIGNTDNTQAVTVTPTNGSTYYVRFTSAATGCSTLTSVTYTVNPLPTLTAPNPAPVCVGSTVDLSTLQTQVTAATGTFEWFAGNPSAGGTAIATPTAYALTATPIYVRFTDENGCKNTTNFTYPTVTAPTLNTVANQNLCAAIAPASNSINLTTHQTQFSNATNLSFTWYKGAAGTGTLLNNTNPNNDPANQSLSNGQTQVYSVVVTNQTGCSSTGSVTYTVYQPVTGITATYNCTTGLQINYASAVGGSGSGYHTASGSPNQAGQILAHGSTWTVWVEDGAGCDQATILTGEVDCPICEAGAAGSVTNNVLCCDEEITIPNTTALITESNRFTIAWGLSPFANGAINNVAQVQTAADAGWVYQANADNSLTLNRECFSGEGTIPAGRYYATPFISKVPPQVGPPAPIIYDPANNCDPYAQICPSFTGTGWELFPMLINLPNGSTINVAEVVTAALIGTPTNLPITQALLNSIPQLTDLNGDGNNDIPCIALSTLYDGDPNGTWTISITNTGTGALNYTIPDFDVTVSADSCTLITQDQVSFVAGIVGSVAPGQTVSDELIIPSPQVTIPEITYDPANNCDPYTELCPTISGNGWEICDFYIQFPEGSPVNVIATATAALSGTPLDVCITQSLLNGIPQLPDLNGDGNNDLPCIPLNVLYNGNPNGEWCFRINNTGGGALSLDLPDFELSVSADSCTLITQDEVYVVDGVTAIIPANTDTTICIQVPSLPSLFPSISDECSDYGTATVITLLDDISYESISATCANEATHSYVVTVQGLHGGAPGVISGATYQFPAPATYNATNDTYTFTTTINSFPHNFNISSTTNGPTGSGCNSLQATLSTNPCVCVAPEIDFYADCLGLTAWRAEIVVDTIYNCTYILQDNQGSTPINITSGGTYYIGNYSNLSAPTITLAANNSAYNITHTFDGTTDCSECAAGTPVALSNPVVCCDETVHFDLNGENVKEELDIIGWAIATQPIVDAAGLSNAVSVAPSDANFNYDFTNNCDITPGNYFVTPFISRDAGDPITLQIPYDPSNGCVPNALLSPTVNCPAAWGINPLILHYPDGTSEDLLDAVNQSALVGTEITCTLWDVVESQGLLPLSTNALFDGNPNGTWCLEITNTGTEALIFGLPDFSFDVTCNGQNLSYPINGVSGTIPADGQPHQICFEVNAGTIIPGFPEIDPLCTDFGTATPLTIVDDINFDFTITCNDANSDGLTDGYEAIISNISGGAPGLVSGANYSIPSGYNSIGGGSYRRILPVSTTGDVSVTVGSMANGNSSCSSEKIATVPTDCPTTCGFEVALASECLPNGNYQVLVNVLSFGSLNTSYRVKVNGTTVGAALTAGASSTVLGPYPSASSQNITVEGIQYGVCSETNTVSETCITCNAGTAAATATLVCAGDSTTIVSTANTTKPGSIISYVISASAADDSSDIANATRVVPSNNGSYVLQNDGTIPAGVYQVTPFISQPAGAAVCPQIPYNPAAGCVPTAGIMPDVAGTGWVINPLTITFPDGSSKSIFEAIGQAGLEGTPITPSLWSVVETTPGLLPLQMTSLYTGDPNGEWCLTATNVGTGDLLFSIADLEVSVTCNGQLQTFQIAGVSGTVAAGTTQQICFTISAGACYIPDFPAYNDDCYDFGTPTNVILTNDINYTLGASCYDGNNDGISDGYELTISNITGGAPQFSSATYVLPSGFTQIATGVYSKILPTTTTGTQTVSISSSNAQDCAVSKSIPLPTCIFTACTNPTAVNTAAFCNADNTGFNVTVNIVGGTGNSTYTISGGGQTTVGASGTVLGPFDFGTAVTVSVTGAQYSECGATAANTVTKLEADCAGACHIGLVSVSNDKLCCGATAVFDYDEAGTDIDTNSVISYALASAPVTNATELESAISTTNASEDGTYSLSNDCDLTPGVYYVTPFIAQQGTEPICPQIPYDPANGCIPDADIYPSVAGTGWSINPLLIQFPDGSSKTIFDAIGLPGLNGTAITPALWGAAQAALPLKMSTLYNGDPNGTWCIQATNNGTGDLVFSIADFVVNDTCDGEILTYNITGVSGTIPGGGTTMQICFEVNGGPCQSPEAVLVCPEIPYDPANGCIPDADIYPDVAGTDWSINPLLIQFPDGSSKTIFDAIGLPGLNGTPITAGLWGAAQAALPLKMSTLYNGNPNGTWCIQATNNGTGELVFSIADFVVNDTCDGEILTYNITGVSGTIPGGGTTMQICFEVNGGECYYETPTTINEDCSEFAPAIPIYLLEDMSYVNAVVECFDDANNIYTVKVDGLSGGAPGIVPSAAYTFPAPASQIGSTYSFNTVINSFPYSFNIGNSVGGCSIAVNNLTQPNCEVNLPPVVDEVIAFYDVDNDGGAFTFNLLDYVSDPNGNAVIITNIEQLGVEGTISYNADGTVTYTPNADFEGEFSLNFSVADVPAGATSSGMFSIAVVEVLSCSDLEPIAISDVNYNITNNAGDASYTLYMQISGGLPTFDAETGYVATINDGVNVTPVQVYALDSNMYVIPDLVPPTNSNAFILSLTITDELGCSTTINREVILITVPIELLSFAGEVLPEGNLLHWATASEINNDYFSLQHALDGKNFSTIATIDGAGNSSAVNTYQYKDRNATAGLNYYRLLETDFNGKTEQAGEVITLMRQATDFAITQIAPIPATNFVSIVFSASHQVATTLQVHDITGRLVHTALVETQKGTNLAVLNLQNYAAGIYYVTLNNGTDIISGKIIKK